MAIYPSAVRKSCLWSWNSWISRGATQRTNSWQVGRREESPGDFARLHKFEWISKVRCLNSACRWPCAISPSWGASLQCWDVLTAMIQRCSVLRGGSCQEFHFLRSQKFSLLCLPCLSGCHRVSDNVWAWVTKQWHYRVKKCLCEVRKCTDISGCWHICQWDQMNSYTVSVVENLEFV